LYIPLLFTTISYTFQSHRSQADNQLCGGDGGGGGGDDDDE
jgi:hypothetical protein